ncbi:MAG: hypothetical protein M1136_01100 [Chloroflexi bacterium]|nr:hypothetical protein [Chloroflexota bacterium]
MGAPELKVELSRLRLKIRQIDSEIANLRRERGVYRQMGFGRDIKDTQILLHEEEKRHCQEQMAHLRRQLLLYPETKVHDSEGVRPDPTESDPRRRRGLSSWLLLPLLFILLILQFFQRGQHSGRRERAWRALGHEELTGDEELEVSEGI